MRDNQKGLLLVVSGPSAVGKGTICRHLLDNYGEKLVYSVSATTRPARPGEINGKDYFFKAKEEFLKCIENDAFLEWAKVYDNYYGTPQDFVERVLNGGNDCILEIDIQGAQQVKSKRPDCVSIFIMPPSKEELIRRIINRGTEDSKEIEKRMGKVDEELSHVQDYNYVVVNDNIEAAAEKIMAIITAEKCKVKK